MLVFGSDGLYEFISNDLIAGIILKHLGNDPEGLENLSAAAKECVMIARGKWAQHSKSYIDDITCVIVDLRNLS